MERLLCPTTRPDGTKCDGDLRVRWPRRQGRSTVLRYRRCRRCGFECTTREFVVDRTAGFRRVMGRLLAGMTGGGA